MPNIPVFPGLVIIILTLFMTPPLLAEGAPAAEEAPSATEKNTVKEFFAAHTFSVSPLVGILYGQGEEIVYKSDTDEAYLSQLLWDLKPLVYFGTALDFSRINPRERPGFFASLSMKFGLPMVTGIMEDRDWIADSVWNPAGDLTNYSAHNVSVDGAYMLDFLSGASLPIRSAATGKAYLGLSYMRFKWTGQDGYLHYGVSHDSGYYYEPVKDSDPIISLTGPVISYSQEWFLFFAGLSASVYVIPKTVLTLSFQGSPLLWFTGQDDHYLRMGSSYPGQFVDKIALGVYLEPGGSIVFSPTEKLSLGFNIAWRYIQGRPHGESSGRRTGAGNYQSTLLGNTAGAAYQALDSSLSLTIRF